MQEFNDMWDWLAYVRETNTYLIALPSFVALFLACIADWVERYLTRSIGQASPEQELSATRDIMAGGDRFQPSIDRHFSGRP